MSKAIEEAKYWYNQHLERAIKAQKYLDNKSIPIEQREKWVPEYQSICEALSELLDVIGEYTQEEALEGFRL